MVARQGVSATLGRETGTHERCVRRSKDACIVGRQGDTGHEKSLRKRNKGRSLRSHRLLPSRPSVRYCANCTYDTIKTVYTWCHRVKRKMLITKWGSCSSRRYRILYHGDLECSVVECTRTDR